ncbi:MAG: type VI secretion system baseplate subunit TssG [Rhodothalassiaceae bacterium]
MAADDRPQSDPVVAAILNEPRLFSFFQAVELIERRHGPAQKVGELGLPEEEVLRFRPNASLGFPGADIQVLELRPRPQAGDNRPLYRLTVNFAGLYGPSSPLPAFYTETILAVDYAESPRRDFLDLFHHRLISLLHRVWRKYRYYLRYEPGANDRTSEIVYAFFGLGPRAARDGLRLVHVERLLRFSGLMAMDTRSPKMMAQIIGHYFDGAGVDIAQFIARWVTIPEDQRVRLGCGYSTLGEDMTIGDRLRDIAGKFRIILGPLSLTRLQDFLPDGRDHVPLIELVNTLLRDPLDFEVELRLKPAERPALSLGGDCQCRLGWTSWLGEAPLPDPRVRLSGLGRQMRLPKDLF